MSRSDRVEDILGPVDGAYFRQLFPTPVPGEVVPSDPSDTLEDLDTAWERAIEQAHARPSSRSEPER